MAVSLNSLNVLQPVYTDNLQLSISGATGNTCYYQLKLYIAGILQDTFNYPASPTSPYTADINVSTLLQSYFESSVYLPTGTTNLFELVPNSVILYRLDVSVYTALNALMFTGTTNGKYCFNGCANIEDNFDIKDFIMSGASAGNFLTNWHTNRAITINDKAYISVLSGNYSDYISNFDGVIVTRYQYDGSSSGVTFDATGTITDKCIINIDVSPAKINANTGCTDFINAQTEYYTIQERQGYSKQIMSIYVVQEYKITKFYNFMYVNKLGGLDFFTFVKVSNEEYLIKKGLLDQYTVQKVYYTDVEKTTVVQSQFLSAYQADKLKELFNSPAVKLWKDGKWYDIGITNKKLVVLDRYPKDRFQQFEIEFQYSNKYYSQLY